MNRIAPPLRGLFWKEARQVTPLVLMLVGLSAMLVLIWSVLSARSQFNTMLGDFLPLLMPELFAAGVAAILVGQEKDTRTMQWCSSLPIAPTQLVSTKYLVAGTGLVLMWCFSYLIGGFKTAVDYSGNPNLMLSPFQIGQLYVGYWLIHSIFVLCCGFYTAWKFKNSFASLVALIPLALLPYLITQLIYAVSSRNTYISLEKSSGLMSVVAGIGIIVFAVLGYRAAMKSLEPQQAEDQTSLAGRWMPAWRPVTSVPIADSPFQFSLSSLIWQSIHHNRAVLLVLSLMLVLGTVCGTLFSTEAADRWSQTFAMGVLAAALAASWLGVFVFSGDGSAARMRFLADRGVSPTLAWIGRQLIGLTLIATATLLYTAITYWLLSTEAATTTGILKLNALSMLAVGFLLLAIYSISQWASQLIGILAASAVAAPILSCVALWYLVDCLQTYRAPTWTLVICVAIPLLITWMMMRRYMDNQPRWPMWTMGVVAVAVIWILPVTPYSIDVWNYPAIPTSVRNELLAEAMELPAGTASPQLIGWGTDFGEKLDSVYEPTENQALQWLDQQPTSPNEYLSLGDMNLDSTIPLHSDRNAFWGGLQFAEYLRVKLRANPDDAESMKLLGEWIQAYAIIAKRLRLSDRLFDQEFADTAEIWLTAILSDPQVEPYLDQDFAQVAIEVISDQSTRNAARRRALLASWRDFQTRRHNPGEVQDIWSFGGVPWIDRWLDHYSDIKRDAIVERFIDSFVATTIQYIEVGSSGEDTAAIRHQLQALFFPAVPFEKGPYANAYRATGAADDPNYYHSQFTYPATQWFAPWEAKAKQLRSQLSRGK